eukprot:5569053-Prymnesium_polylepis.1
MLEFERHVARARSQPHCRDRHCRGRGAGSTRRAHGRPARAGRRAAARQRGQRAQGGPDGARRHVRRRHDTWNYSARPQ